MSARRLATALAAALLGAAASACVVGPRIERAGAYSQYGMRVEAVVRDIPLDGELLEVSDTAIVVLADGGHLFAAGVADVRRLHGGYGRDRRRLPPPRTSRERDRLRRHARYPHGIAPEVMERLLAAARQPALVRL